MLIHVQYNTHRFDFVKPSLLDDLIDAKKISKFKRSTGWATVGLDPIRSVRRK